VFGNASRIGPSKYNFFSEVNARKEINAKQLCVFISCSAGDIRQTLYLIVSIVLIKLI